MNEQRKASENGTAVQIGAQTLAHAHVSMHLYAMLWPAWSRSWHLPIECAWFVIARIFLDQMHVVSQSCMKGTVTVEEKLVSLCFFYPVWYLLLPQANGFRQSVLGIHQHFLLKTIQMFPRFSYPSQFHDFYGKKKVCSMVWKGTIFTLLHHAT